MAVELLLLGTVDCPGHHGHAPPVPRVHKPTCDHVSGEEDGRQTQDPPQHQLQQWLEDGVTGDGNHVFEPSEPVGDAGLCTLPGHTGDEPRSGGDGRDNVGVCTPQFVQQIGEE